MSFVKLNGLFQNINILKIANSQIIYRCKEIRNYKCHNSTQIKCKSNVIKEENLKKYLLFCKSDFHTTIPNRARPPLLRVFIRYVLKIAAVFSGSVLRLWWSKLPSGKQRIVNRLQENQPKIWLGSFAFGGIVSFYYVTHLVEDQVSKRKTFHLFSAKQILEIYKMEADFIVKVLKHKIIKSGKEYKTVLNVFQRILESNKHFPDAEKKWAVFLINDNDIMNAFALPSGHIFIFTGIFKLFSNDDQLAVVLAHEMAHVLLNHESELMCKIRFMALMQILTAVVMLTLLPDFFIVLSSHMLYETICLALFSLHTSREIETEADIVGLDMVARACYDPRQAAEFWINMKNLGREEPAERLSSHPHHKTRYEALQRRMPEALKLRDRHCAGSDMDPRK